MDGIFWRKVQDEDGWRFDAIGDFPQMDYEGVVLPLLRDYPGAKFILNMRGVGDWVERVMRDRELHELLIGADLPELPPGAGGRVDDLAYMLMRHWARVQAIFAEWPERLLLLDIDRGPQVCEELLTAFLERPVRWPTRSRSAISKGACDVDV